MMACPCAQEMVRAHAASGCSSTASTPELADRVLALVPIATHNQRGRGRLMVGADRAAARRGPRRDRRGLDELGELRPPEAAGRAVRRGEGAPASRASSRTPCARCCASVVSDYPDLPDDAYVHARQVNMETIHKHDVFAERGGQLGEIRGELADGAAPRQHRAPGLAGGPARELGAGDDQVGGPEDTGVEHRPDQGRLVARARERGEVVLAPHPAAHHDLRVAAGPRARAGPAPSPGRSARRHGRDRAR